VNVTHPSEKAPVNGRAYAALVIGIIAIAWSAIFIRWAPIPGPASAFYRMLIAGVLLWPYLLTRQRGALRMSRRSFWIAMLGGAFFAGDLACYNTAVLHTSAANAVLLSTNAPIVVGVLSWIVLGRAPRPVFWLGLAIATSGSLLIVSRDLMQGASFGRADMLAIATSFFFGGYLMVTEHVRNQVASLALLGISLFASMLCLGLFDLVFGISMKVPHDARIWAGLLGMGIVSQLIGYFALTYALGHLPATVMSVTLLAQAPVTALLAFVLLAERYSWLQAAGALLVLAGILVVNLQSTSQFQMLNGE
jgi:drug/metabolite transporter (DMT)-like permease